MDKVFRGGVPYAVDVKRLIEAFPVPSLTEGRVINHIQLEGVLDMAKGAHRYYAVVNSWIAHMKNENGIFMVWEPAVGVTVLDPAGILSFAENRTRHKLRQTGRAVKDFGWVNRNRLDSIGQQRFDHINRVASAAADASKSALKGMSISLAPVKSLPRPKLIKEA
jgi:hypothetical protein